MNATDLNAITSEIIKAAIEVHKELGPGLLESVYQRCLAIELRDMRHNVACEVPVTISYRGAEISDEAFRVDMLVDGRAVVELKSVELVKDVHKKQLLTYLKLTRKRVGLLINFNESLLKDGITRIVNDLQENPCADPASQRIGKDYISASSALSARAPKEAAPSARGPNQEAMTEPTIR